MKKQIITYDSVVKAYDYIIISFECVIITYNLYIDKDKAEKSSASFGESTSLQNTH